MKIERLDNLIAGGLLGAIAFTTLAHGAVESWSAAIFELLIILLLLLWVIKSCLDKRLELNIPRTFWPIAVLLILGIVQIISFKDSAGNPSTLSADSEATSSVVKILFFLLAAHLIGANFFNTKERMTNLAKFLIVFGLLLAVFALLQYFTWNGKLYWIREGNYGAAVVNGPFVNRNHFASFLELLIPLPIALIITGALKQYRIFFGFAAIMMAIATVASLSRGGIISLVCGLLFAFLISFVYQRRFSNLHKATLTDKKSLWRRRLIESLSALAVISAITGAVFIGTVWIGMEPVIDRLSNNSLLSEDEKAPTFEDSRGWIWENSLKIFYSNPVYGIGLGAYETAYPKYSQNNEKYIIDRAHNDYLQILTDTGVIGAIIALWFIGIFVFNMARLLRQKLEPLQAGIAIGSAAGIFSLLIHSIFDFNLQIPSNALLFLVLTAVFSQVVSIKAAESIMKQSAKNFANEEEVLALGASA